MYLAVIIALMGVLPILSILVEFFVVPGSNFVFLVGKWFVFWAVGVRLFLAGLHQIAKPEFTAESIFGIKDKDAGKIVAEVGFGNLAIGLLGLLTIFRPSWIVPAAIAGGLFLGLAGIKHVMNRQQNEAIPMVSDLAIFAILVLYLIAAFLVPGAAA